MKLRILGNTIRFRLSRSEMEQLENIGVVENTTDFGLGAQLLYKLEIGLHDCLEAIYSDDCIRVFVPKVMAQRWMQTDEITLQGEKSLDSGAQLKILLEKDFACRGFVDVHSPAGLQCLEIRFRIFSPKRQLESPLAVLVPVACPGVATGL